MSYDFKIIDTHTHLYFSTYNILEELVKAGYTKIFNLAYFPVLPSSWQTLYDLFRWLTEEEPNRFQKAGLGYHACIGIHPRCVLEIPEENQILIDKLNEFLNLDNVCGIGEIGLELVTDE